METKTLSLENEVENELNKHCFHMHELGKRVNSEGYIPIHSEEITKYWRLLRNLEKFSYISPLQDKLTVEEIKDKILRKRFTLIHYRMYIHINNIPCIYDLL